MVLFIGMITLNMVLIQHILYL